MSLLQAFRSYWAQRFTPIVAVLAVLATYSHACAAADDRKTANAAEPGDVTAEKPTLKCLGVRWLIGGDGNADARVGVAYRRVGNETWRKSLDLFRVETARIREPNRPPAGRTLFAGSVFDLDEGTEYEVRLSLKDPDGGDAQRVLRMRTWAEPRLSPDAPRRDVYPGQLAKALSQSQPGQVLRLHGGVYGGTFRPNSGTAGRPIGIIGAGVVLPNINDGHQGNAPDLGAYELGRPLPHYGLR